MRCWMTSCQQGNYQGPTLTLQVCYNNRMKDGGWWVGGGMKRLHNTSLEGDSISYNLLKKNTETKVSKK